MVVEWRGYPTTASSLRSSMQIDDDVNDDVNDDDRKERQRDRERRARREDEDVCGDLFSLNYGREVVCLFLSLSLSLSLSFVKNLCFVFGVEDFCFKKKSSRVSSPKSVGTVVSLFGF